MTQIQHVTDKEMTRRTGVQNALGYTYPDKDLILLKKGLKGKKKREVLDHELNHLAKGEEGPFWGGVIAGGASLLGNWLGNKSRDEGQREANRISQEQYAQTREDMRPGREFNARQLGELQNWLSSDAGKFNAPTMEDVTAGAGYGSRMGAVEGSAAAKGSLFSGNALRDIGDFGAREYEKEYGRRRNEYQGELSKRMGLAGMGEGAVAGSANASQNYGRSMAGNAMARGGAEADMYGNIAGTIGSAAGAYQGQQNWNSFLDKFKKNSAASNGAGWETTEAEDAYGWG